ncbi:hypothetical protein COCCADRAFT_26441 [Bipolaris zeicola 26-R-13]|uniref:F-box domain-containing protein n=1 Tax=Cochliobolus carbonum (strain 26-R-13) TaxID=930089 RepID=W6YCH0_COCC2|nr:uncharacterized protein COCCADRAFT_26441 [Bipolaris zeicola 26-R-13]EUC33209.1 hypothetical protein COCCADRAFT_26441 [Bipolaris zeicola 26-R-13]
MASTKGLPVEIFQQIYGYLGPKDFNAARRTCRAWMEASLDRSLLAVMLERGGWTGEDTSKGWQMLSCQLARECALAPGRAGVETEAVFTKSSEVDFSGLRDSQVGGSSSELIFTTSTCSRFLCVAQGALIRIYQLDAGRPVYMASVECPGRVLAMTMGPYGGSSRYAIAAILEGRTWNLVEDDSTIYSHLGSEDDPPRSVALCPQGQCVVFGCSEGLDVQWIDSPSGQSLHRWVPSTAPNDHVYVRPRRRPAHDSSNILRILSSPAHHANRPWLKRRLFPNAHWHGSSKYEIASRQPNPTGYYDYDYDYYNRIPLDDNGSHVLFVDQISNRLVLGTDELVRKIEFVPPTNGEAPPKLYRAAADMSQGARIVAVYDDTIMLYSVPRRVCRFSPTEDQPDGSLQHDTNHWLNWWDEPRANGETGAVHHQEGPTWPLSLRGTRITTLANICEISVQTSPCLVISAVTDAGKCKVWKFSEDEGGIGGGEDGRVSKGAR